MWSLFYYTILLFICSYYRTMNSHMYRTIKQTSILWGLLFFAFSASAQFSTRPFQENIKALQVTRADWNLSYPVIYLDKLTDAVEISFDLVESEAKQISYSIIHCDARWKVSDLSVNEYLDGFQTSYADDYQYSQATNIDYVNYKVYIPNQDVQLRVSGNYAVVFFDEETEDTLLTACFSVVEPIVDIFGAVGGISTSGRSKSMQQLNFTVNHANYAIRQPLTESTVLVKQNNNVYPPVITSTPTYIHTNKLIYEQNPNFAFPGGDEYRTLETSSVHFTGEGVLSIDFFSPFNHVTLRPSPIRHYMAYTFDNDINGKFLIRRQESDDENAKIEADYIVAHFTLPMEDPILDGKVYVGGDFTYNLMDKNTQMTYNSERKAYEASFMLKQGYYNYRYYVVSNRNGEVKSAPIEMDAYQTENDYQVFFFHRPMGERYDRLIGYKIINSIKN